MKPFPQLTPWMKLIYVQAMTVLIFLMLLSLVVGGAWWLVQLVLGLVD